MDTFYVNHYCSLSCKWGQVVTNAISDSSEAHDGDSDQSDLLNSFLWLPTPVQLKGCYHVFYNATSNNALASMTCGICACNVNVNEEEVTHLRSTDFQMPINE